MKEQEIIDLAVREASWEDVITYCVMDAGLDPWDVDVVKLANVFLEYIKKLRELDFNLPARLIMIATIFVRLQVETLFPREEYEAEAGEEIKLDLEGLPDLVPPVSREPRRKVTLHELINALQKAFAVESRREERRIAARRKVEEIIPEEEPIEERIKELYQRILRAHEKQKLVDGVKFSRLVKKWELDEVIRFFLPLLHLEQERVILCKQPDFFKEIFVKLVEKR
jgi:segregation and condensation protein A